MLVILPETWPLEPEGKFWLDHLPKRTFPLWPTSPFKFVVEVVDIYLRKHSGKLVFQDNRLFNKDVMQIRQVFVLFRDISSRSHI